MQTQLFVGHAKNLLKISIKPSNYWNFYNMLFFYRFIFFSTFFLHFLFLFFSFSILRIFFNILSLIFIRWCFDRSKETVDNGLNVIIDIQLCSWRYARTALQYVNELLNNKNAKLYAVRSEVFIDNCTKTHQYLDVSAYYDIFVCYSSLQKSLVSFILFVHSNKFCVDIFRCQ